MVLDADAITTECSAKLIHLQIGLVQKQMSWVDSVCGRYLMWDYMYT